jgi:hypothetical protein
MAWGRRRGPVLLLAILIVVLFAGRWGAVLLSERWWAAAVAPEAMGEVTRRHLYALLFEGAGLLVASLWCVGQLLLVVGSIHAVQVPRRIGNLEIRELVPPIFLRQGAVAAGLLLGLLLGSGGGRAAPMIEQAWRGVTYGIADPLLGLDLGVYLVQLPVWSAALGFAERLAWSGLAGAALCHLVVGGIRLSRRGIEMTESARLQVGVLFAVVILLAAGQELLGPLRAVAGVEREGLATFSPATRWGIATAWGIAALAVGLWALRPWPPLVLTGLGLWAGTGLLTHVVGPARGPVPVTLDSTTRPIADRATGLERLVTRQLPEGERPPRLGQVGLWDRQVLGELLTSGGGRVLAFEAQRIPHAGGSAPVWFAVRSGERGVETVAIADDRLGPRGAAVSFREGDAAVYPGVVSWHHLTPFEVAPDLPDTVAGEVRGGVPVGTGLRRLILAWGSQRVAVISAAEGDTLLHWRRAPRDRAAALLPEVWWDAARPIWAAGELVWVIDGWLTAAGAPFAPSLDWEGDARRYARAAFRAVVRGVGGRTRIYLRADADPYARAVAAGSGGMIAPPESLPSFVAALPYSDREVAVLAAALRGSADSILPLPALGWGAGPEPQAPITTTRRGGDQGRLEGMVSARGGHAPELITWVPRGPVAPRALRAAWQRFATFERLSDSVAAVGGRLRAGPVRYLVTADGTVAVEVYHLVPASGAPTVAWVNLAAGEGMGAARTPAAAWANLLGESAPLVPEPDLPDAMREARRWAALADSALRAGDLEAFGRAFEALKRVLGTP